MSTMFRRLRCLVGRSRHDADVLEEIEAHRALRQDAFERDGLAPEDAAVSRQRTEPLTLVSAATGPSC